MATVEIDAREFGDLARDLRQAPKAIRVAVKRESRARIAEPLAGRIRAAATGPWSGVLAAGVKTRAGSGAEAVVAIGGARPKLRGGAGPRHVVFGAEFGGGKRIARVPRTDRHRGYRRYATNQFRGHHDPFVFPTAARSQDAIAETYAEIVLEALDGVIGNG